MTTTVDTYKMQPPVQTRDQQHPLDFFSANLLALLFSVVILFAFLFLPWLWEAAKYNGARLMADVIFDSGFLRTYSTTTILIIPIVALTAAGCALWGVVVPHRGAWASILAAVAGVIGLYYYVDFYLVQDGEVADYVRENIGLGFKVTLVGMIGLVLQIGVVMLPRARRWLADQGVTLLQEREEPLLKLPSIPRSAIPYLFLAVPFTLYFIWIIAPTAYTFYLSLTRWDGVTDPRYLGFDHYQDLFDSRAFREALGNNARWLVIFITVPTTLGLGLAMIFNTEMRGGRWYKVSFYSPLVLSWPVIGLVWAWMYHPRRGLINSLLVDGGITDNPPGWLADREIAIYCIIAAAVWRQVGYVMVLYLAGLKNIDPSFVDAALVDGTNRWQLFRHVIFPLLAPVTTIIVVISVIDSLRAFDLVQIITRGNTGTEVLANMMYMEAFNNYRMGYGGAIAVVLFSISVFFVGLYLWYTIRDELEY